MSFRVTAPKGPGERDEERAEATPRHDGKRLPFVEVGEKGRWNPMLPEVPEGSAGQREGPFETIGTDQLTGHAEGVEKHLAVAGVEARGIVLPDA